METDYTGTGQFPLQLIRVYNSRANGATGAFGANWTHPYEAVIRFINNAAIVQRPDGKRIFFALAGGVWNADSDVPFILNQQKNASGTTIGWTVVSPDNQLESYDASGKLLTITDQSGATQTLTYDANSRLTKVTDPQGHSLTFVYNSNARVQTMTDPSGGVFTYGYDAKWNLTSVTRPDSTVKSYVYNEAANTSNTMLPNALTGIYDGTVTTGIRFATYQYDTQGRAILSEHSGGAERTQVAYNANGSTVVTDALGAARTYGFQTVLGVVKSTGQTQPAGSGCAASAANLGYDANGNIASRTDFNGNRSCFAYDLIRNLETARVDGLAPGKACPADSGSYSPAANTVERKITSAWHADWRLEVKRAEPKKLTLWVYNGQPDPSNGNAVASCAPASALLPDGKPIAVLCKRIEQATTDTTGALGLSATLTGTPRTWAYTYNSLGQVLTADGPRTDVSDVTSYSYYSDTTATHMPGDLATLTNALGHVTQFTNYDKHGHLLSLTDPNGLVVGFSYDARGRLTGRTVDGNTTGYAYDAAGNLTQVTLPTTDYLHYTYDAAHRLTDIADAQSNRIHYTLDGAGNRTQEDIYDPGNVLRKSHHQVYDALSRLSQDIGAAQQTRAFGYDPNGNLTTLTDANGHAQQSVYDALDRPRQVTDALAGITQYAYDAQGHVTQVTDPNGLVTQYAYDGLGNRTQEISPNTGTTTYLYDAAGNLTQKTDARNVATRFTYDALNRPTSEAYTGVTLGNITLVYDQGVNGLGRLSSTNKNNVIAGYSYDKRGNRLNQTLTSGSSNFGSIAYRYDGADRLSGITYPSGRKVDYLRDSAGRISAVTTTVGTTTSTLAGSVGHLPFGPLTGLSFGNNLAVSRSFDDDYRLSTQTTGSLQNLGYAYDPAGNLTGITGSSQQTFGYDALDRLTNATGPYGSLVYTYDADGNRLQEYRDSTPTDYHYLLSDQKLRSLSGGNNQTYPYDAIGNLTQRNGQTLVIGKNNRLTQVKLGSTLQAEYIYDPQGRRFIVTKGGVSTYYQYSPEGLLLSETRNNQTLAEYIYLDGQPLALVKGSTLSYLTPNHLGAPALATNAAGAVVWQAEYEPFGQATLTNATITLNLRLPGQYYDAETGLHYNLARHYDPTVGRYIESDPIGLASGINTYAYVLNNPLRYTDPLGLAIDDYPPAPPGYNPGTWTTGQWDNGKWVLTDPDGRNWTIHPEDKGHWRHWDKRGPGGKDERVCSRNGQNRTLRI